MLFLSLWIKNKTQSSMYYVLPIKVCMNTIKAQYKEYIIKL